MLLAFVDALRTKLRSLLLAGHTVKQLTISQSFSIILRIIVLLLLVK